MATDYEKKYKEALERAKRLTSDMTTLQKIREFIFPELVESEDERIRKELVNFILYKAGRVLLDKETEHRFVAYLEKQKVQKPGEIPPYVTGIKGDPDPAGVWKPSEEQMNALYYACCIAFKEERCFHPSLSRLYHDLRKL